MSPSHHLEPRSGLLTDRRAIVAGGSAGIGAATVRSFAEHGANVVVLARNERRGAAVAQAADDLGPGHVHFLTCDLTDRRATDAAFERAGELLRGLDVLVVPAGDVEVVPAEGVDQAHIDRVFAANVNATVYANIAAHRLMREGGSIVNYSAGSGVDGFPGMPVYSAAKGAVLAWTRSVAREWGPEGIRANAVVPAIATPGMDRFKTRLGRPDAIDRSMREAIPLGGALGEPEDAAAVNVFLASDLSRFVTGQTIPVDGGLTVVR